MNLPLPPQPLDVPAELVAHIAVGMENPEVVAARYGFVGERWEKLVGWKPFVDAVEAQRVELERSGYTFRVKSAMKADALADKLFVMALANDTPLPQKLETLKLFAKLGDLEPSPKVTAQGQGAGFSITIDLSGSSTPKTIKVEQPGTPPAELEDNVEDAVELESLDSVDKSTTNLGFTVPDFSTKVEDVKTPGEAR